jgi:hypothetical protein
VIIPHHNVLTDLIPLIPQRSRKPYSSVADGAIQERSGVWDGLVSEMPFAVLSGGDDANPLPMKLFYHFLALLKL